MVTTTTLSNGVRVITKRMEGLLSVTMGVLVGTGAAFERDEEDGISHFIEHMQFKGTDKFSAFELSDAFDAIGAQVNAFTGKDLTCYYAKSTSDHAREAFSLLSELFLRSTFPEEEMAREKGVVLEEIGMDEDTPEDLCLDLLSRAAFGNDNYGRNILGPRENVEGFTREQLFAYKKERYCPGNIVISFAGNIEPALAEELAEKEFGALTGEKFVEREKKIVRRTESIFRQKPIEQAHFAFGFPTVPRDSEDLAAVQVMNAVLGGGMSSRLFKRVREELGLAYSVYSYTSHYRETGMLTVYAGVNPSNVAKAQEAIEAVIADFCKNRLTQDELARGREQLKSSLVLAQENTASQMLAYGKYMLYNDAVLDFEKRIRGIDAITMEDCEKAISLNFGKENMAASIVGKVERPLEI